MGRVVGLSRTFSIVISTYNRADSLERALASLAYLRHPAFEVIVVNGPSTDRTADVIARYADKIKIATCPEVNLSMSRNIGIAAARGDIVAFLDDDAVPEPDWLDQLETGYTDNRVAGVGGFIRDHTGVAYQCKVTVCDRFGDAQSFETIEDANRAMRRTAGRYLSPTGTNSSFRRQNLLAIGGFDEEFAYFLDETDVNLRLTDAGYEIRYVPAAEVHHKYAASHLRRTDWVPNHVYPSAHSKAYFCCRYGLQSGSLHAVFERLGAYAAMLKRDSLYHLNAQAIDRQHFERLVREIDAGIRAGIHQALSSSSRNGMTEELLERYAREPFKRFEPTLPAEGRLRVCFVSQDYPPHACGGIGVWTHTLATALARLGHEVSVVSRGLGHPTMDQEDGVWVHRISTEFRPGRDEPPLPDLPQPLKERLYTVHGEVMRIRERRGLDVVSGPIWDLENLACLTSGTLPTVLSLHTTYKLSLPSRPEWLRDPTYLEQHVEKVIDAERFAIEHAPFVLANSHAVVRDVENAYDVTIDPARVAVVPHGLQDLQGAAEPYAKPDTEVRILFVGRLELRKGVDTLLDAVPPLLRDNEAVRVVIVGDDSLMAGDVNLKAAFLRTYAGEPLLERVRFEGQVAREPLLRHYATCDIFVAPSRYESLGLVFLEAMMFGKPCIGTRVGGIEEVIAHGETGLLVRPDDPPALAAAIRRLVEDASLRRRMGAAGRRTFESRFGIERMRDRVLDVLQDVRRAWQEGRIASGPPKMPPIAGAHARHPADGRMDRRAGSKAGRPIEDQRPTATGRVASLEMNREHPPQQVEGLQVTQGKDGYILYQADRGRVHHLNHIAALVLEFCNGQTPAGDIPKLLRQAFDLRTVPHEEVWELLLNLRDEGIIR